MTRIRASSAPPGGLDWDMDVPMADVANMSDPPTAGSPGPIHEQNPAGDSTVGGNSSDDDPFPFLSAKELFTKLSINATGADQTDGAAGRASSCDSTRKRAILRSWPRDPKGKNIIATPDGKRAGNGLALWGATLFDFYRVQRFPSVFGLSTISTGSKLAAWMKENGETTTADYEIAWAEREEEPREIYPCDIGKIIPDGEMRIRIGAWGKPVSSRDKATGEGSDNPVKGPTANSPTADAGSDIDSDKGKGPEVLEKKKSLYDVSTYPPPWPLVPFSYHTERLQKRLPLRLLPKQLVVHDPWALLSLSGRRAAYRTWSDNNVTLAYTLEFSPEGKAALEKEEAEYAAQKAKEKDYTSGYMIRPVDQKPGPIAPPIFVIHPPQPEPEPMDEPAHLYLSPRHSIGEGNHSVVYHAEWELPRTLLVQPVLCKSCIDEAVASVLEEEDGKDGKKRDKFWDEKSGMLKLVKHEKPALTMEVKSSRKKAGPEVYTIEEPETTYAYEYEGPVRPIDVSAYVHWQDGVHTPYCKHYAGTDPYKAHPPTARVRVVAKLSKRGDDHLLQEAENYQAFPRHMFEHWSGFNVVPPLHDPVPASAIVPQFYGHYVPDEMQEIDGAQRRNTRYLSPILLMEDCGEQVDPKTLSLDDRQEVAALIYRLHCAGWVHGSVFERNILVQPGPLTTWPLYRNRPGDEPQLSFRLIDFGRSMRIKENFGGTRAMEEAYAGQLLGILHYAGM